MEFSDDNIMPSMLVIGFVVGVDLQAARDPDKVDEVPP